MSMVGLGYHARLPTLILTVALYFITSMAQSHGIHCAKMDYATAAVFSGLFVSGSIFTRKFCGYHLKRLSAISRPHSAAL
mmetsp:Transcript_32852/g.86341  ORF Transcript_32852/g.86341 Transcript_32852/m.86341 type:complete len:80 (-) Transcript_32852:1824-2063(-)